MTSANVYLQALLISLLAVEIAIAINEEFDGTGKSQDRGNNGNGDGDGVYFEPHFNLQINHFVLHTITKACEKEMAFDENGSMIKEIIEQVTRKYGVFVQVNERIIELFRVKIKRMNTKVKQCGGGRQLKKLLNTWKNDGSFWTCCIYYDELFQAKLLVQNEKLTSEKVELTELKRKAENELSSAKEKLLKLDEEMESIISKDKRLKKKFQKLARQLIQIQRGKSHRTRGPSAKKFSQYSRQHRSQIKKGFINDAQTSLSFLGNYDFVASSIVIQNNETGKYETLNLIDTDQPEFSGTTDASDTNDIDNLNFMLYVKDKFNVSDSAYLEMSQICKDMPRVMEIKETY